MPHITTTPQGSTRVKGYRKNAGDVQTSTSMIKNSFCSDEDEPPGGMEKRVSSVIGMGGSIPLCVVPPDFEEDAESLKACVPIGDYDENVERLQAYFSMSGSSPPRTPIPITRPQLSTQTPPHHSSQAIANGGSDSCIPALQLGAPNQWIAIKDTGTSHRIFSL